MGEGQEGKQELLTEQTERVTPYVSSGRGLRRGDTPHRDVCVQAGHGGRHKGSKWTTFSLIQRNEIQNLKTDFLINPTNCDVTSAPDKECDTSPRH